jgi:hypothetical protein
MLHISSSGSLAAVIETESPSQLIPPFSRAHGHRRFSADAGDRDQARALMRHLPLSSLLADLLAQ